MRGGLFCAGDVHKKFVKEWEYCVIERTIYLNIRWFNLA